MRCRASWRKNGAQPRVVAMAAFISDWPGRASCVNAGVKGALVHAGRRLQMLAAASSLIDQAKSSLAEAERAQSIEQARARAEQDEVESAMLPWQTLSEQFAILEPELRRLPYASL